MVEHTTHNRVVGGSNPPTATISDPRLAAAGALEARLLVALSGGPDSTALLLLLLRAGFNVVAAHFDHDLRPGSAEEAEQVARLCSRLGVELVSGRRRSPLPAGSIQAAARELRYRFLEAARVDRGLPATALGHIADDLVESVLMNLLRGAGLPGMSGMPARRGPYRRPLLDTWRTEIEAYLADQSVVPLRDPSNADTRYSRVRVRVHLLPELERARPGIAVRIRSAARAAAVHQERLELAAAAIEDAGGIRIDRLLASSSPVRTTALRRLYEAATGRRPALGRRHLMAMDRLVLEGSAGQTLDLPGAARILRGYTCVQMIAMDSPPTAAPTLVSHPCGGCEMPGAGHFRPGLALTVGRRRPGLRMRPLPGLHSRKLQDILVDAKIPRHLRDGLPLVFADGELAWVPGVAIDGNFAALPGEPGVHAELAGSEIPSARIQAPTQGVFPQ